ncbi:diguanylate cyclase [Halopseudomonas xiamenensis]|uniref:diguanylate cyclase n=1 Tax=Halopseudomonas xiamenensis TaxID=157792 RepID=UPI001625D0BD|nr:diguanylate cyclase [Halopseudomonas xiamenensis]
MPRLSLDELTAEWQHQLDNCPDHIRQLTAQLAVQHKTELAAHFYAVMLQHPEAALFLSHEEVKSRLSSSMENWVCNLYSTRDTTDIQSVIAHQNKIGEVHARVSIPVHLVLRGARLLKRRLIEILRTALPPQQAAMASSFAMTLIDLAMEIMSHAYSASHDRHSRAEESYRLFAVTQNIASEKEKQRAALLDWENQLMFDHAMSLTADQLPRLRASEFGLWFRHKGAHGFEGALETGLILDAMAQIDDVLLPLFALREPGADPQKNLQLLRDLREQTKSIAYHLDLLFEQNNELESGRDVLTRLLNRKFLSVVLNKQINYARDTNNSFAVLSIDLDHFKQINDTHGHEAGDLVLQQFASMLLNKSRAGDYLFRMGGEEFLMIMVDVNANSARRAAEKIRALTAAEVFRLPQETTIHVTASLGLALFTGHPDYQQLLRRADSALYEAKHSGRDQVVVARD